MPTCASKQDVLELAILWYSKLVGSGIQYYVKTLLMRHPGIKCTVHCIFMLIGKKVFILKNVPTFFRDLLMIIIVSKKKEMVRFDC